MAAIKYIDLYKNFLTLVRKSRVGTVTPIEFTSIYNLAQEEIISQMLKVMDLNKTLMIGLLPLRKVSDNLDITVEAPGQTRYKTGVSVLPIDCRSISRITVKLSLTTIAKTNLIKSNEISSVVGGVYSHPTNRVCFYHLDYADNVKQIRLYIPNRVYELTPIKYPTCKVEYYQSPPTVLVSDVTDATENGKVSIFDAEICTKITNAAARMYIENVENPRYQTFNNELNRKN